MQRKFRRAGDRSLQEFRYLGIVGVESIQHETGGKKRMNREQAERKLAEGMERVRWENLMTKRKPCSCTPPPY